VSVGCTCCLTAGELTLLPQIPSARNEGVTLRGERDGKGKGRGKGREGKEKKEMDYIKTRKHRRNKRPVKLKFHWDQFPRNFPVANVTVKSPTSYEEVGDVANKSARKLRGNWSQWNLSLIALH